jgi:hypothetical protein
VCVCVYVCKCVWLCVCCDNSLWELHQPIGQADELWELANLCGENDPSSLFNAVIIAWLCVLVSLVANIIVCLMISFTSHAVVAAMYQSYASTHTAAWLLAGATVTAPTAYWPFDSYVWCGYDDGDDDGDDGDDGGGDKQFVLVTINLCW